MNDNILRRVEQACTALLDAGEPVTFTAVAAHSGLARTTLYRNERLRAVIDEHRTHRAEARRQQGQRKGGVPAAMLFSPLRHPVFRISAGRAVV